MGASGVSLVLKFVVLLAMRGFSDQIHNFNLSLLLCCICFGGTM
jgi:hypothetical protein